MSARASLLACFLALLAALLPPAQGGKTMKINALYTTGHRIGQYTVIRRLGKGGHSKVYEVLLSNATEAKAGPRYALKFLYDVNDYERARLEREILMLRHLSGGPNIIKLVDVIYHPKAEAPLLVLELARGASLDAYMSDLSDRAIRSYMFQLLRALNFSHRSGIIHKDIKFENILVDPSKESLLLVDFALAEFTAVALKHKPGYGTPSYSAPEVLLGHELGTAADCWAAGAVFGGMLFQRRDMFPNSAGRHNMLVSIAEVLGTDGLWKYLSKSGIRIRSTNATVVAMLEGGLPQRPWKNFVTPKNKHLVTPEALDLLSRLLRYDPAERVTAGAGLSHLYFKAIREQYT